MESINLTGPQLRVFEAIKKLASEDREVDLFLRLPSSGKSFCFGFIEDHFKSLPLSEDEIAEQMVKYNKFITDSYRKELSVKYNIPIK